MYYQKKYALVFFLILFYSQLIFSQEIGKIFILSDAENQFGNVLYEHNLENEVLKNIMKNTLNYVMFDINNNDLTILGDGRILLYTKSTYLEKDDVFHLFSKSLLENLMNLGNSKTCNFQKREKAYTIQNGQFVLEYSLPCPPYCH